jgi:hypothetical protein
VLDLATTATTDVKQSAPGALAVAIRFVGLVTDQDDRSTWRRPRALTPR